MQSQIARQCKFRPTPGRCGTYSSEGKRHKGDGMDASHPLTDALADRDGREYGF
jgi:hypothetical protein